MIAHQASEGQDGGLPLSAHLDIGTLGGLALCVVFVAVLALVVYSREGYASESVSCCRDHQHYLAMSGANIGDDRAGNTAPFAYRVVTPLIVRALPVAPATGFHIVSTGALLAATCLLFLLLRRLGFSPAEGISGVMLAGSLYWLLEFPQLDYALVDPLNVMMIALVLVAMYRGWSIGFLAALLFVSALNKETIVIVIPSVLLYLHNQGELSLRGGLALATAPAAALLVVHASVRPSYGGDLLSQIQETTRARYGSAEGLWIELRSYLLPTWGPVLIILAAQPLPLLRFAKAHPELLVLFASGHLQLFASHDTGRVLVLSYIAVVSATVFALRTSLIHGPSVIVAAAVVAVAQGFYFQQTRVDVARISGAANGHSAGFSAAATVVVAAVAVGLAATAALRQRSSPEPEAQASPGLS